LRLDARGGARAVRVAVSRIDLSRATGSSPALRSHRGADVDVDLDQDRRLSGRLRLLSAKRALRHGRQGGKADARRGRPPPGAGGGGGRGGGASRFCMGAAWREPKDRDLEQVCAMVEAVKAIGLETCATLGMLTQRQARRLKASGLDYYNHNLDTSPEYYGAIITTRTYQDRLDTLGHLREAGIH